MKKLFIYYCFILTSIMTIAGLLGATSYAQVVSAILFLPLTLYFLKTIMPRKRHALILQRTENVQIATPGKKLSKKKVSEPGPEPLKLQKSFDVDRRMFIKLIGSAGISIFLLSIFTQKAHGAFFGSVPGPGTVSLKDTTGAKIDPAVKHPTDGYKIARLDDSTPAYYGFLNKDGAWFIMKEGSDGTYKYAKGSTNFATEGYGWSLRDIAPGSGGLTYADFDVVFD